MVRRSKTTAHDHDADSLSEDIDDVSLECIEPKKSAKKARVESVPWVVKYQPRTVSEVSINPRKANEVRDIFTLMAQNKSDCRLLVLSGPAGSSKSTLARSLAQEVLGSADSSDSGLVEYFDSSLESVHQAQHFQEFMDGCRYLVGANRRVILIEDLPNVFHTETLGAFRSCLKDWIFASRGIELPPVVLCFTEVEILGEDGQRGYYNIDNCMTVETVLGRDLLNSGLANGLIRRVKFLPVAKTYIKKSLSRILASERSLTARFRAQSDSLNSLYESGDIRSSISSLEFMSRGCSGFSPTDLLRESQITLFHAVGKVIHSSSKTRDSSNTEYSSDYESVKDVVDNYHNRGLLYLALLENYQICNGSQFELEIAANIVDSLSLNDTFTSSEAAQDFAIRATRTKLGKVEVRSGRTLPMKFPRQFKSAKEENKVRREVGDYVRYLGNCSVSFSDVNLIDGYFLPKIKNSHMFRAQNGPKPFIYNRIGGTFKGIYADDDMPVMEDEYELGAGAKDQFSEDISAAIKHSESMQIVDDEKGEESDEIEDSTSNEATDDDLDDTLDDHILQIATQSMQMAHPMTKTSGNEFPKGDENKNVEVGQDQKSTSTSMSVAAYANSSEDEFSDDAELAILVSQGRL